MREGEGEGEEEGKGEEREGKKENGYSGIEEYFLLRGE